MYQRHFLLEKNRVSNIICPTRPWYTASYIAQLCNSVRYDDFWAHFHPKWLLYRICFAPYFSLSINGQFDDWQTVQFQCTMPMGLKYFEHCNWRRFLRVDNTKITRFWSIFTWLHLKNNNIHFIWCFHSSNHSFQTVTKITITGFNFSYITFFRRLFRLWH